MIGVIINFCSNEKQFLDPLISECSLFADEIVISYADKLYNGDKENLDFLDQYQNKENVKFVQYQVDLTMPYTKMKGVQHRPTAYWHNLARFTAVKTE